MKKLYAAPEFEVLKCTFIKDTLTPSTEGTIPIESSQPDLTNPTMPTELDF
ncbi:MAG: hypothetical protein IJ725_03140 [Ruminococcus sp.]|nr:hypothetical protein [Ruminococcus sp.]